MNSACQSASETSQVVVCVPMGEGNAPPSQEWLVQVKERVALSTPVQIVVLNYSGVPLADMAFDGVRLDQPYADGVPVASRLLSGEALAWCAHHCPGQGVLLLRPDVMVPPYWGLRLVQCARGPAWVGSVSPLGTSNNLLRGPIAALGGARNLAYPFDISRFLCSVRLALGSLATVIRGTPLYRLGPLRQLIGKAKRAKTLAARELESLDAMLYNLMPREPIIADDFDPYCVYFSPRSVALFEDQGAVADHQAVARLLSEGGAVHARCSHMAVAAPYGAGSVGKSGGTVSKPPIDYLKLALAGHVSPLWPGLGDLPVNLHVRHGWGGGLKKWVQDFCQADDQGINLVLQSVGWGGGAAGRRLELFLDEADSRPLLVWNLNEPISSTTLQHAEYAQIIRAITTHFAVDRVIVSSLIGHSIDLLDTGRETVFVCHDYYPYCHALNIHFGGVCTSCDDVRLARCIEENPYSSHFLHNTVAHWTEVRQAFLSRVKREKIRLVAPSQSVVDNFSTLDVTFRNHQFSVIPHGSPPLKDAWVRDVKGGRKDGLFRVLCLGRIGKDKGQENIRSIVGRIEDVGEIYLVGTGITGMDFMGIPRVHVIPSYSHDELPGIIREIDPDLGVAVSQVLETFSYTLTELFQMGIPTLANRMGAYVDRICDGKNGFLVTSDPVCLVERIQWLREHPKQLDEVRHRLSVEKPRDSASMVADYYALFGAGWSGRETLNCEDQKNWETVLNMAMLISPKKLIITRGIKQWVYQSRVSGSFPLRVSIGIAWFAYRKIKGLFCL